MTAGHRATRHLWRQLAWVYGALSLALWPIPVFGLLHAESSAVVAGIGCLTAAVTTARGLEDVSTSRVVRIEFGALAIPLVLLTATLLWRPNCGYAQGLGLFAVLVPPSVLFGLSIGTLVSTSRMRWPRTIAAVTVLILALGGVVLDLRFHPQLFTYSHVFGGVLGPIYDEELAIRPGLFAAKAQTLLWAVALLSLAAWRKGGRRHPLRVGLVTLVVVGASYLVAQPLGIVQTRSGLEDVLSLRVDLGAVVLHLDPEIPLAEQARLADEVLFRFETLSSALEVDLDQTVNVYLYPDADTKAALIGSRTTSVVPVWLRTPQIHMLADEVGRSLGHEMVHVLAREFGMSIIGASPAIGLVEGLAVALEPPDGWPSPTALVAAGRVVDPAAIGDPAQAVRATMSLRFWTSRAGVAYTANGAFVRWLLDTYGAAPVKAAYRTGRFQDAFGRDLDALTQQWSATLADLEVDPEAVAVAEWLFSRPSLFEVRCPHWVPPAVRLSRSGLEARDAGDLEAATAFYGRALEADPLRLDALVGSVSARLASGADLEVADLSRAAALVDTLATPSTLLHLADLEALSGRSSSRTYQRALDSLSAVDAVSRFVIGRRRDLEVGTLRGLLAAGPEEVPRGLVEDDPVLAALRLSGLDRPLEAWALARVWCLEDDSTEASRVARWLQARIAYRAGALEAAGRLFQGLPETFRRNRPTSLASLVEDDIGRVEWRQTRPVRPPIFDLPPPASDALATCAPDRSRPVGGRLRAP